MNWGGFASGLAGGVVTGMKLGEAWEKGQKQRDLNSIREKGIAEATAKHDADTKALVKEAPESAAPDSSAPVKQQNDMTQRTEQAHEAVTGEPAATAPTPAVAPSPAPTETQSVVAQPSNVPATPLPAGQAEAVAVAQPQTQATAMPPQAIPTPQVVQGQPAAPAPGIAPVAAGGVGGRFTVGNQSFATREEALAAASKKVPDISEYVTSTLATNYKAHHIANGDIEQAEKFDKFIESERGRGAIKSYGTAMNKLMFTDDIDGAVDALGDYYNKYVDDNVDFTGGKRLEDGRIEISVKGKGKNGKESKMVMTPQEIVRLGMSHDPVKMYDMLSKQVETQQKDKSEIAKEIRKEQREDTRDGRKHEQAIELKTIDSQLDGAKPGEIGKKVRDLKALGWDNKRIDDFLTNNEYKKATDPAERRALIHSDSAKNNHKWSRMTEEEKRLSVDESMRVIYGEGKASPAASGVTPAAAPSPTTGKAKGKGVPVYDTATGGIVYK